MPLSRAPLGCLIGYPVAFILVMVLLNRWVTADQRDKHGIYSGFVDSYIATFLGMCALYLIFYGVGVFAYGWLTGRDHLLSGPWFTGVIGFGDGSAVPGALENFMLRLGAQSASRDLYYYDHVAECRVASTAPPIVPRELVKQGFRGRSDDPILRKVRPGRGGSIGHTADGYNQFKRQNSSGSADTDALLWQLTHGPPSGVEGVAHELRELLKNKAQTAAAAAILQRRWQMKQAQRVADRTAQTRVRPLRWLERQPWWANVRASMHLGKQRFSSVVIALCVLLSLLVHSVRASVNRNDVLGPYLTIEGRVLPTRKVDTLQGYIEFQVFVQRLELLNVGGTPHVSASESSSLAHLVSLPPAVDS